MYWSLSYHWSRASLDGPPQSKTVLLRFCKSKRIRPVQSRKLVYSFKCGHCCNKGTTPTGDCVYLKFHSEGLPYWHEAKKATLNCCSAHSPISGWTWNISLQFLVRNSYSHQVTLICFTGSYWNNEQNRKSFFCDYAASRGFDPLVSNNWYTTSTDDVLAFKVSTKNNFMLFLNIKQRGAQVMKFYARNLGSALQQLFPDIGLDEDKFKLPQSMHVALFNEINYSHSLLLA